MAALSVPSLTSDVDAGRAAEVGDSYGPTPILPLSGDVHRWGIAFNCGCRSPQRAYEASALPILTSLYQCSSWAGPARGPWAGPPMGLGWTGIFRKRMALDWPGLEF